MHTSPRNAATVLYVFAHQDDEYGINARIRYDTAGGKRVVCVYLTDGGARVAPAIRERESRAVLLSYGVAENDIAFLGSRLGITDGALHHHALDVLDGLLELVRPLRDELDAVYTLAWEGGHHDHDATHVIVQALLTELDLMHLGWQYGMYDGAGMQRLFRVMRLGNRPGTVERRLSLPEALRAATECWRYPSQRRTWLGLFPEAALRWVWLRREVFAPLDPAQILERPHPGPLLYERLFGIAYEEFTRALGPLRERASAGREQRACTL